MQLLYIRMTQQADQNLGFLWYTVVSLVLQLLCNRNFIFFLPWSISLYMLHKSSYHPSKANRGYIYFSYLVGLVHEGAAGRRWRVIHKVKQTWCWVFHYCLWLTMRPLHSGPENTLSISIWKDCCEDQWEYASIHINMHINTHKHVYKHTQASTVYVDFL